jgi:hypothetical protein
MERNTKVEDVILGKDTNKVPIFSGFVVVILVLFFIFYPVLNN